MNTQPPLQNHALAFLKLLDPEVERFNFRTFSDCPSATTPSLTGNFQGDFQQVSQRLQGCNERGAGVFVVINEGGQKKADITRVRAVYADTDGAELEPIVSTLTPHIVVNTSPGKWHVYWLVSANFPLDQFKPVQLAIANKFSTDKNVADLSRVMRLPGFNHNKTKPYPVQLIDWDAKLPLYNFDQIIQGLGLNLASNSSPSPSPVGNLARHKSEVWRKIITGQYTKPEIEEMLSFISPACDRKEWMDIIFTLAFELGEDGRELADRWSRGDLWDGAAQ